MSALDALLGRPGEPVTCRRINDQTAMHWWAQPVQPGDPCLCGELPYRPPTDENDE